ncbi:MAG: hypothetical protein ACI8QC_001774 [Planctomycetota bacterium]|jgi:hypothetical protein
MQIHTLLRSGALAAFVVLAAPANALSLSPLAPAAPTCVQDDVEFPDKRPEVKDLLSQLKGHAGKRGKEDLEAKEAMNLLLVEFKQSGPKDRAAIVKGFSGVFKEKRQEDKNGVRDNQIFITSAYALGEMGPESVKSLTSWIDHKSHRKDLDLQRRLILSLGKTKDLKAVKTLIGLLVHRQAGLQGAASEALGNYDGADQKVRKDAFNSILKVYAGVSGQKDSDPNDTIARERYDAISAPMNTALALLSGEESRKVAEWQRFWNKNKKKNWDK